MRRVVEREGGCIVWGGAVRLSPADDIIIRVERPLDLDSEGQLVASVLSKKAAAGSSHVVIDIPVGETAKVRSREAALALSHRFVETGHAIGLTVHTVITDGAQPVGRGIGPALEARDVLAVLRREANAPKDLRERALRLAGAVLEFAPGVAPGKGMRLAQEILDDGRAWNKFEAICIAQGGLRTPAVATHTHTVAAAQRGQVTTIDNRRLARVAKLAGAPRAPAAGLELHVPLGTAVEQGQPLFTVHAEATGELAYALAYVQAQPSIVRVAPA
jgi:thymidine phosphorylase